MIERLTVGQQRALAVGLMLLLLGVIYLALVQPFISAYQDYDHRIAQLQQRRVGYKKIASNREILQKELDRIKRQVAKAQAGYFNSRTKALAAAELQNHVKRVIEGGGGHLASIQILQSEDKQEETPRVAIKVQMTGAIETAQKVFYTLESGQPRLFIDNLYLRAKSAYLPQYGKPQSDQLDIRFNLSGFLQPTSS